MGVDELRAGWERLGQRDPLWAVLTDPSRQDGKWTEAEFLASGEHEMATVFDYLAGFRPPFSNGPGQQALVFQDERALDFGCGAGRLTQALARRFDHVDGVDIAEAMLAAARALHPPDNVAFHHNPAGDLRLFPDGYFDLIYSSIVLQHMPSPIATGYISEFQRITKWGGAIVFQVPDRFRRPPPTAASLINRARVKLALGTRLRGGVPDSDRSADVATLGAHATPERAVRAALPFCTVLDVAFTNSLEPDFNGRLRYLPAPPRHGWTSKQYIALVN